MALFLMNFLNFEIAEFTVSSYNNTMAKKNNSLLGDIFKGAVNLTGEVIKITYDAATSKTAQKIYKETANLTKDAVVGTAGLTKDAVVGAVDLLNTSPKKKIIKYGW